MHRFVSRALRALWLPTSIGAAFGAFVLYLGLAVAADESSPGRTSDPTAGRATATAVRLVLITLDTVRFDVVMGRSPGASAMPRTRAFVAAHGGAVFDRHYSASNVTQPTHASLFTGLQPWQHGVTGNAVVLADRFLTVAERLRSAGFETNAVVASFPVSRRFGFAQGFDRWEEPFDRELVEDMGAWHGVDVAGGRFYSLARAVSDAALKQLGASAPGSSLRDATHRSLRQFFWFHYFDAHGPYGDSTGEGPTVSLPELHEWAYERPEGFTRKLRHARKLYRADIVNVDRELGRVLDRLAADFPRIATHIVIVADHGESFGERGRLGHGRSLDPVEIHVPLMIVSPDLTAGRRSDPVGSIDVAATLLALGGLRPSLASGQDLRAEPGSAVPPAAVAGMKARPAADDPVDDSESGDRFFAVIGDAVFEGNSASVSVPAGEKSAEESAPETAAVRALFGSFESRLSGVSATRAIDPETERALRALGYLP